MQNPIRWQLNTLEGKERKNPIHAEKKMSCKSCEGFADSSNVRTRDCVTGIQWTDFKSTPSAFTSQFESLGRQVVA